MADRAYGAKTIRAYISEQGASYVIPPQSNVSEPWPVDWWLYKERHLVERFSKSSNGFAKLPPGMTSCLTVGPYQRVQGNFLCSIYKQKKNQPGNKSSLAGSFVFHNIKFDSRKGRPGI